MKAFDLLIKDHRTVSQLFDEVESTTAVEERKALFQKIKQELDAHTYIEETVLYPFFRQRKEFEGMIDHAYDEHMEANTLMAEIGKEGEPNELDNKLEELIGCIEHHVEDEETGLFPKIKATLSNDELDFLGEQLEQAKAAFLQKLPSDSASKVA